VFFAFLLCAVTAVPGVAASDPSEIAQPTGEPDSVSVPSEEDVLKALREAEEEQAKREAKLESPVATEEREDSETAFAGLGAPEAEQLLATTFAEQLEDLAGDPARFLSEAKLIRSLGDDGATVRSEGDTQLMEAGIPVRAEDEGGDLHKVDLSLEADADSYQPENPLVDLDISKSAQAGLEFGEDGIGIAQTGIESSSASRLGDIDLFYPEVATDTDLVVSPIAAGVELFNQLRSSDSPRTLHFALDLPDGADLRLDGNGGAEVSQGDEMLAHIPPPSAIDAQGSEVPVSLEVEGASISLQVSPVEGEAAFPILVDPILENWGYENWDNGYHFEALEPATTPWTWNEGPANWALHSTSYIHTKFGPSGRGLYISSNPGSLPSGFAQWQYATPNAGSYLANASIGNFHRYNFTCPKNGYPLPYDFDGMWHGSNWNRLEFNKANDAGWTQIESWGDVFIFGLGQGNPISMPCPRDIAAGGAAIWLDDYQPPYISSVTGIPSGWINDVTPFTINVKAEDAGLGVQFVQIIPDGAPVKQEQINGCTGLSASRCPTSTNTPFVLNAGYFGNGVRNASVSVKDPTGKTWSGYSFQTKIDRTPPDVTLNGQLAIATNEAGSEEVPAGKGDQLSLPVYNLEIKAKDGVYGGASTDLRSGVKNIEVFLDEKKTPETVPWTPQECPESSCPMTKTYQLKLQGLSAGAHVLRVIATDQVEQKRERKVEFEYIPATGITDDDVLQRFPLPDGQGNEAEEEDPKRPELAVNVMNGNLVYRERDIDVEGYGVDLEVERFYNSQLPDSENTEWGDGWTLAQTPSLDPEAGADPQEANDPQEAKLVGETGAVKGAVLLPTEVGKAKFDPKLQATITKEVGGGYELADEAGETDTAIAFDSSGRTEELRTESQAKVNYEYAAGKLDEIAVKDPASVSSLSQAEEQALEYVPPAPSYLSSFGASGTGDGQLKAPADVAVAANGNLWVVDKANNRIQQLTSSGAFVSKAGTAGSGNGQFNRPTSIAIDALGNLWVTDAGNNRVQKFNGKGEFLKAVGSLGSGNGQFKEPEGVATDAKGNVWVADTFNQRIQKLNSAGEFLAKYGSSGTGDGQFSQPASIDIGPAGKVWVADWGLNRITQLNEAGGYVQKFGAAGIGNGQFSHPDAIEVDTKGNVFVGDQSNNRVQQFNQAGKYVAQFGAKGTGSGQFTFASPMGIAVDNKGGLWVTDVSNNRVQKWAVPGYRPTWFGAFGSLGSGDGQLKSPADIAIALNGDAWIVDKGNNRIERFNQAGQYVSKFGSVGSGNGQFSGPTSIAIDASGNLWVADGGNSRVQKFSENGAFLKAVGSLGSGNGQFNRPEGIATDLKGNIYVADTYNKRIQKLNEAGEFISKFGSAGSGPGQFTEANAIDIGRGGKVWVADWGANRIEQFNEKGEFAQQFGSTGAGDGQFSQPDAIEADNRGNVWVGDQSNGRIELFNEAGEYLTQFGAKGSGEGQFSFTYPMGIVADHNGDLWVTDVSNNRIQKWLVPSTEAPKVPEENDPSVDVNVSSGLVSSIEGEEAGTNTYAHTGELLTAHNGPSGEVKYAYDAAKRLTKVTLPNGTWGEVTYNTTYGRVSKVKVDPAGTAPAKTTYFTYSDEPRRTEVAPPEAPTVTYDIGADGSVLRWWNTPKAPEFNDLAGNLYAERETSSPITPGDKTLTIEGYSEEGIASIQVIANGNQVVHEKSCAQDYEKPGTECVNWPTQWVMNTQNFAPGILNLEAVVTDDNGHSESTRFWVNIPPPPPPLAEGTPVPPTFEGILHFREEFGLDIVDPPTDELARNERIFDLLGAWWKGDPTAVATTERWGVPMRTVDVAEMEYRENYIGIDGALIKQWAESHAPTTYAGYYVDHRQGGIIHVGFTANQSNLVASLKQEVGVLAANRITTYAGQPKYSLADLGNLQVEIGMEDATKGTLMGLINHVALDPKSNTVVVGAVNVGTVDTALRNIHGASIPIEVIQDSGPQALPLEGHYTDEGPIHPGHAIGWYSKAEERLRVCTAGYGAKEKTGKINPSTGQAIVASFVLTAGHCFSEFGLGFAVRRFHSSGDTTPTKFGTVARRSNGHKQLGFETDVGAIRLEGDPSAFASSIFRMNAGSRSVSKVEAAREGMVVSFSGANSKQVQTGVITGPAIIAFNWGHVDQGQFGPFLQVPFDRLCIGGDSGSPVWTEDGKALGLVVHGTPWGSSFTPLLVPELPSEIPGQTSAPNPAQAPGILDAPGMGDISLTTSP
jgi:YD repeat-containing protein